MGIKSFRRQPAEIKLAEEQRPGFQAKLKEYRGRLRHLTRDITGTGAFSLGGMSDGVPIARGDDEIHSQYKLEICESLLQQGSLNFESLQDDMEARSRTHRFKPNIFRDAYGVVLGYCKGTYELPQVPGNDQAEQAS